jgi:hypothetical protein
MTETHLRWYRWAWIAAICALVFVVTYTSPVSYTSSDPWGSLLTSQALVRHGSVRLDAYSSIAIGPRFFQRDGHSYYFFPLGNAIFAMPFVWLGNTLGKDMSRIEDDAYMQNVLSALTTTASFLIIYLICKYYTSYIYSILISVIFVFGSSLINTLGTALWGMNFEIVFTLLCVLVIVRYERRPAQSVNPYILGLMMFAAYICRPTAIIFICAACCYLLWRDRPTALRAVATFLAFISLFALFSLWEYHTILPEYYLPARVTTSDTFWVALYGNLLSPSRGLLVYSSFLILTFAGVIYFFKRLYRNAIFWLALVWFVLHMITISSFPHWWGGWGFGTRLITDAFPALILLTLVVWDKALSVISVLVRRMALGIFVTVGAVGIFINTYQGLYNISTMDWSMYPNIDAYPGYIFDWRYPQFLANPRMLSERHRELAFVVEPIPAYVFGVPIVPNSSNVLFEGWYPVEVIPEGSYLWSRGKAAHILFRMEPLHLQADDMVTLELQVGSFLRQKVDVLVNDRKVGSFVQRNFLPSTYTVSFDASLLKFYNLNDHAYNHIELLIPGAASPASVDKKALDVRVLGIRLLQARLYVGR